MPRPDQARAAPRAPWAALPRPAVEDLAWLGLVPAALVLWAALAWLAPPLSDLYPEPTRNLFPEWSFLVDPEPLEDTRFFIATAAAGLFAVLVAALGSARAPRRSLDTAVVAVQTAALAFVVWCIAEQHGVPQIYQDYFDPLLIPLGNLLAGVALGAVLVAAVLGWQGARLVPLRRAAAAVERHPAIAASAAAVLTALWLLPGVFTEQNVAVAGINPPGHIALQFEDYLAVANGRTPLADFITTYASVLPMAVGPLLPLFGTTMASFSAIMCLLSLAALMGAYLAFREVTGRTWTALALYVPFLALSLIPWATDVIAEVEPGLQRESNGTSFSLLPDRYLGPLLLAWLVARHLRRGAPPAWALFGVAGLTVLNNVEFGLPCLAAVIGAVALDAAGARGELRDAGGGGAAGGARAAGRAGRLAAEAAAGLAGAFVLVSAVTLLRAGQLPDLSLLTYWPRTFSRSAYGLEPMATLGLHWVLYLTYTAALVLAVVRFRRRAPDRVLTSMLAYAGLFGLATGGYFAGRSQQFQLMGLFPAWGLALALLAWTAALALRAARDDRLALRRLLLPGFAALAGLGMMASTASFFPLPWRQAERLSLERPAAFALSGPQRFVEERTDDGDAVLILGTPLDHRVAERAGVENTSPLSGLFDILSEQEVTRTLDQLDAEGGDRAFIAVAPDAYGPFTEPLFDRVRAGLRERGFRLAEPGAPGGLEMWERR